MDVNNINPFLKAFESILIQLGANSVKKSSLKLKKNMTTNKDVTTFVGLVGSVRGNISYSFTSKTAIGLASLLMGMELDSLDEIARSSIAELSNMITGNAVSILEGKGRKIDITTPTVVLGEDMYFVLGTVDTIAVEFETQYGIVEVNFGLEI
ncbi:MAG: chemotaxis protein CheX [Clostridiales bacterium]